MFCLIALTVTVVLTVVLTQVATLFTYSVSRYYYGITDSDRCIIIIIIGL